MDGWTLQVSFLRILRTAYSKLIGRSWQRGLIGADVGVMCRNCTRMFTVAGSWSGSFFISTIRDLIFKVRPVRLRSPKVPVKYKYRKPHMRGHLQGVN